ncbi:hypothetical protein DFJ74DRAFT_664264 [Hyaloraphidium curvatum]|nr:hypothetical protein DFJ74DRAFT_664264 [Hyaloraphidium curvatum]
MLLSTTWLSCASSLIMIVVRSNPALATCAIAMEKSVAAPIPDTTEGWKASRAWSCRSWKLSVATERSAREDELMAPLEKDLAMSTVTSKGL